MKHGKARFGLRLIPADHIRVRHRSGRDKLALAERCNRLHPVAQLRRSLKFQSLGGSLHLTLELFRQALVLPFEKLYRLLQQGVVLRLRF